MRINELLLKAFGPFTDTVLDFSGPPHGLHVVYGDNEAGKSSSLRAIRAALFGIPHRTTDGFLHANNSLRVGATIESCQGEQLEFMRRKGNKATLLKHSEVSGSALPEDALAPFLGRIDEDGFARIFAIDHLQMRSGGETLGKLEGLVGESLFAASVGGPELTRLIESLHQEAGKLYSSKKRTTRLQLAQKQYKDLDKKRRECCVSASQWNRLGKSLKSAREDQKKHSDQLQALRSRMLRLQRLQSILPKLNAYRQLMADAERFESVLVLPPSWSVSARNECQSDLTRIRARVKRLKHELFGDQGIQRQLDSLSVPEALLRFRTEIGELQQQCGAIRKARVDIEKRRNTQHDLVRDCEKRLRDIDASVSLDEVASLRVRSDQQEAVRALATDEKHFREQTHRLGCEQQELEQQLQQLDQRLEELAQPLDLAGLRMVIRSVGREGDLDALVEQLANQREQAELEFRTRLASLPLWNATEAEFIRMKRPLRETVDQFEKDLADAQSNHDRLASERTQILARLDQTEVEIATIRADGAVPDPSDLDDARQRRDATWKRIENAMFAGDVKEADRSLREDASDDELRALTDAFVQQIAEADRIADALRQHADQVAHLSERRQRKSELARQNQGLETQIQVAQQRIDTIQSAWHAAWQSVPLTDVLTPREMRGWLDAVEKLESARQQLDGKRRELADVQKRYRNSVELLENAFQRLDMSVAEMTLREAMERAESLDDSQAALVSQRSEIQQDRRRLESQLEKIRREYQRSCQERDVWQKRWSSAMAAIGCPADALAEQAHARLNQLTLLFEQVDETKELADRVKKMEDDERRFSELANALAEKVALDSSRASSGDGLESIEIATRLREHLDAAIRAEQRYKELDATLSARSRELEEESGLLARREAELAEFCRVAKVEDPERLPGREAASAEALEYRNHVNALKASLLDVSLDGTVESIEQEIGERTADALRAELQAVEEQVRAAEQDYGNCTAVIRGLENDIQAIDGDNAAAQYDEQALSVIAAMQQDTAAFARLRVAAAMLRIQIERHRSEHQDPMLVRASEIFSSITCQNYTRLGIVYDGNDQPHIQGVRESGESIPVAAMSDGTRDQLFLALRLAYLQQRLEMEEPLPFIVDDILIHFDDQRAVATLKQLVALSKQTQVIFFTHHRHLVELATDQLATDAVHLHQLDGSAMDKSATRKAAVTNS